ncbi:MAG: radical SAM protein [candidate division Zixibacteria bacterium]|nr:radical SAM protein [candidate division Zixibacteria bacterium]
MIQKTRQAQCPAQVGIESLDNLWFQLSGTICNLSCSHCFISCSPQNDSFGFMGQKQIRDFVEQGKSLGVKEFYFTGGEPFLNKEIYGILKDTLAVGPATVLTNGTTIRKRAAQKLKNISDATIYSLELRVSLDGFDARSNDRLRGSGSFDSALKGIIALVEASFLPIITAVQTWPDTEHPAILEKFKALLAGIGYTRPRIKIIPALNLGAYKNMRKDTPDEILVTEEMMVGYDQSQLICSNSRLVTEQGVYVCPILLDSPEANLGGTLSESMRPYALTHKTCHTCYRYGAICSNFSTSASEGPPSHK